MFPRQATEVVRLLPDGLKLIHPGHLMSVPERAGCPWGLMAGFKPTRIKSIKRRFGIIATPQDSLGQHGCPWAFDIVVASDGSSERRASEHGVACDRRSSWNMVVLCMLRGQYLRTGTRKRIRQQRDDGRELHRPLQHKQFHARSNRVRCAML